MKPGPAIAQQLGPMGITMSQVISQVNEATQEFKGINVPVHLDINKKTKEFTIKVLSPPTSELIKKELGIEKASGDRLKTTMGNFSIEQAISISKTKMPNMLAKDFPAALKSVLGTCMALGVLVENKSGKEVIREIVEGKYKQEIESQKTETSPEKIKKLDEYLKEVQSKQEAEKKAEEEEKAAEEAKKAEAATTGPKEGEAAEEEPSEEEPEAVDKDKK